MRPGLDEILSAKRDEIERIIPRTERPAGGIRDLGKALEGEGISVIAEIKRGSPSHGIFEGVEPLELARAYDKAGAAALSVLTDRHFGMGTEDLEAIRKETDLPILRKDFILDERQVDETFSIGADAILIIASILSAPRIEALASRSNSLGLAVLFEIHDETELTKIPSGAEIIGVNSRDLSDPDYATDIERSGRILGLLPEGKVRVAESGIRSAADIERIVSGGASIDAALVGAGLIEAWREGRDLSALIASIREAGG